MSDASRRFWKLTEIVEIDDGFGIALDGRPVRTPAKKPLAIPNRAIAEVVRTEWEDQRESVHPETMPFTRYLNSAIDNVAPNFEGVVDIVAAFGASDLLCYRAAHPQELGQREAAAWDGVLHWARARFDAPLMVAEGLIHVEQPAASLARLRDVVAARAPISLTALHDLTSISGSLLLALAVEERHLTAEEAWAASRIDEDWQVEQWGEDDLAKAAAEAKRAEFLDAAHLLMLIEGETGSH